VTSHEITFWYHATLLKTEGIYLWDSFLQTY
jgi:hypothetical protein